MNVTLGHSGIGTNMIDVDIAFVFHADGEKSVDGFPSFWLDGIEGSIKKSMVDGFLFDESAKLLKEFGVSDAESGFTERPTFALHENESAEKIIAGEVGFSFAFGGVGEYGEIVVDELEDFGHGEQQLIDLLVVLVIFGYNFGQVFVFELPENRKNGFGYFTHRSHGLLSEINNHDNDAISLKKTMHAKKQQKLFRY